MDAGFDSQQKVLAKERINYLRCFLLCESLNNCAFVVFTAFNSSYSTCSIYKAFPELNKHIFITSSKVMSQKVAYKLASYSSNAAYTELNVTYKLKVSFDAHKPNYVNFLLKLDNEDIASGGNDKLIKMWSNYTFKSVLASHTGSITNLVYLGDSRLASGGYDGAIIKYGIRLMAHWLALFKLTTTFTLYLTFC
jgi:WD40 repeat protein